jgi:hypothetical protein
MRARGQRPLHVLFQERRCKAPLAVPKARRQRPFSFTVGSGAGRRWRRSISLPFAGWLPHERVSSQAYLGLRTGVGNTGPTGLSRIALTFRPAPGRTAGSADYGMAGLIAWPIAQTKPASSRAIAATTIVGLFAFALSHR